MKKYCIILLFTISFSSCVLNRKFPKFDYVSNDGRRITNDFFKLKKTIVITGHLSCPAMLYALKDIQTIDTTNFQLLVILENTPKHLNEFNSNDSTIWFVIRQAFKMNYVQGNILCECKNENIKFTKSKVRIGKHCWKISRKLFALNSPNIYYINTEGKIYKHLMGYTLYPTQSESQKWLLNDQ